MSDIVTPSRAINLLARICRSLPETSDLTEIRSFRDQAEAIRHFAKTAVLSLETLNQAAEVKLLCERRAGQILSQLSLKGGDRKTKDRRRDVTLDELGISRTQSARWQQESALPEEEYVRYVQQAKKEGRVLSSNALLRLARVYTDRSKPANDSKNPFSGLAGVLKDLSCRHEQFSCIYADPPWSGSGSKNEIVRLPNRLCDLPVKLVAAPQAHLHLWVPPEKLDAGLTIVRAWGFCFKGSLVRGKDPLHYGRYWRQAHDVLLLGVRGQIPFRDSGLLSWLDHERLPAQANGDIHALLARSSPPPYLDLFGAVAAKGWTCAVLL